ncbi:pseudouridine synthase [Firmicutes bacterium CAG:194]|jgi:23S rRNA pseudouridine1911/1915/1917 synthase|nr:RluA family pseudouridine synthase [Bacillota bacterium]MDY3769902.1 RluA family pseudouridine synthase [Lachnospiraceae bacterium]OLA30590.1 MAG: RNA pseudouridine synthase [Firmicutes bacterium CAG_194_44_15]CCZ28778.1 pseudouridine synthase [Firmicutes bacterium CAG:194]
MILEITENQAGERIDRFLADSQDLTRSFLQKILKEGEVIVNGKSVKANYKLRKGDRIEFEIPEAVEPDIVAEDIPLSILYEDADVLVVDKPKGMVVHPAAGHYSRTLVNAVMYHCKGELSGINGVLRPGIVHRIDRDTTGSIIICKNDMAHNEIARQLKEHSINRRYRAIVTGVLKDEEGTIEGAIGRDKKDRKKMAITADGKPAVTHYRVLQRFKHYTYVECVLETGRTHQIRVHMASIGHPLLGDEVYGRRSDKYKCEGQCLHAMTLGFHHPRTGEYIEVNAPLPPYFEHLLAVLES